MLKDSTYEQKFTMLKHWLPSVVDAIKKDLKNEHLKKDSIFLKTYFPSGNLHKLSLEELSQGYAKALESSADKEAIGEFIANRWLLKNTELYYYFEKRLQELSENFNELEVLDLDFSKSVMQGSVEQFGPVKTYLFSVMNSVVFPEEVFKELKELAVKHHETEISWEQDLREKNSIEAKEKAYTQHLARLTDKYEKKILGLEKKYDTDVAALKKQISNLQKKLASQA